MQFDFLGYNTDLQSMMIGVALTTAFFIIVMIVKMLVFKLLIKKEETESIENIQRKIHGWLSNLKLTYEEMLEFYKLWEKTKNAER